MSEQIDVLAVMDADGRAIACVIDACSPGTLRQKQWEAHLPIHDSARAAVAELIAAAADAVERGTDSPIHMRLEAALSLVQGGSP